MGMGSQVSTSDVVLGVHVEKPKFRKRIFPSQILLVKVSKYSLFAPNPDGGLSGYQKMKRTSTSQTHVHTSQPKPSPSGHRQQRNKKTVDVNHSERIINHQVKLKRSKKSSLSEPFLKLVAIS